MAVASAPHRLPGGIPSLRSMAAPAGRFLARMAKPARAPLANLASIPLHVAGLGVFDFAAFHLPDPGFWGWAVTAASLIWLEHVIADEQ